MKFKVSFFLTAMLTAMTAMAQPTAKEWNKDVVGWNLGNQFECSAPGQDGESMQIGMPDNSIKAETAWGNPVVTKKTIKAVKEAGFNAIRIPIRWQCHITNAAAMSIDKAWLARIKEVVGWCLSNDLKVIINVHHDKWLEGRPTYQYKDENNQKLALLWLNIASEFAQYDYRVAFAGTNEVHIKDNWGKPEKENLEVQNSYNQTFMDVVRATGGNNTKRHLIVQTYVCNPDFGLYDGDFIIPTDAEGNGNDYMSVEFHYYTPWDYAGECKYNFWGEPYKDKGEASPSDEKTMTEFFDKVVATWGDKGLGIVMGEWGVTDRQKGGQTELIHENITYYCRFLVSEARKRGFSTFIWDNNAFGSGAEHFGIFDRGAGMKVKADWVLKGIMEGKKTACTTKTETTNEGNNFRIKRGTNLSHWLSQNNEDRGEARRLHIQEDDFARLDSLGFDFVRLPIDEVQFWDEDGNKLPEAWDLLTFALDQCGKHHLRAIVDLHIIRSHYFNAVNEGVGDANTLFTSEKAQQDLVNMWYQLSDVLKGYSNDSVAYEFMNEPVADEHEQWNQLIAKVHKALREREPQRTLVIGSNRWQGYETMKYLKVPEGDKNIILSFHYYNPMILTHYGAWWTPIGKYTGKVNYPGIIVSKEDYEAAPDSLKPELEPYLTQVWDIDKIRADFKDAIEVAKKYNLQLFCGEWGVYEPVDRELAYKWTKDMLTVFKENNIAWTTWCYDADFGFWDQGKHEFKDKGLVELLMEE